MRNSAILVAQSKVLLGLPSSSASKKKVFSDHHRVELGVLLCFSIEPAGLECIASSALIIRISTSTSVCLTRPVFSHIYLRAISY